jgi:hypothetical protein
VHYIVVYIYSLRVFSLYIMYSFYMVRHMVGGQERGTRHVGVCVVSYRVFA